ncbi:MAG TPA: heme NO-binding domain-containing protein [Ktedonobacteraceae bacterium]
MKGIIFVVWEKYLNDRFGSKFIDTYREQIGETRDQLPISGRIYPDELLVKGVQTASQLSFLSADRLMVEYGRYFMLNGLVEYLCGYLLAQSWNGADLLLQMRDAHAQMRRTPDGVEPPLFEYQMLSGDHRHMLLTYESGRKLCSLLEGCIIGAAERFGEKVQIHEHSCMKKGAPSCRFEVRFEGESWANKATPNMIEQEKHRLSKQGLSNLILQALPYDANGSMNLEDLHAIVMQNQGSYFPEIYRKQHTITTVHVSQVYTALAKLQQVGLISSTVNQPGDTFGNRRYWRSPTHD